MSAIVDQQRVDKEGMWHRADAEDLSLGIGRFKNGALAHWMLNMVGRGESLFSRVIYGTGGTLSIPSDRSGKPLHLVQRRAGHDIPVADANLLTLVPGFALDDVTAALFGAERLTAYDLPWANIDANLLAIEQADFVDAIVNNREPEVSGEQGLRALALVFGFLESERLGRFVMADEMLRGELLPYQAQIEGGETA